MRLLVLFIFLGLNLNILGQDNTVNIWEVVPNRKQTSEKELIEKMILQKPIKKAHMLQCAFKDFQYV
jgi:hypothetical protein